MKKEFITLAAGLMCMTGGLWAQADTTAVSPEPSAEMKRPDPESIVMHLDAMLKTTEEMKSSFKMELTNVAGDSYDAIIYDYTGGLKAKGHYVLVGKKFLEDGHFTYYFQNGQIESEGDFSRGVKVGSWKRFDAGGKRKSDRYYPAESADKIRETMKLEKQTEEK